MQIKNKYKYTMSLVTSCLWLCPAQQKDSPVASTTDLQILLQIQIQKQVQMKIQILKHGLHCTNTAL